MIKLQTVPFFSNTTNVFKILKFIKFLTKNISTHFLVSQSKNLKFKLDETSIFFLNMSNQYFKHRLPWSSVHHQYYHYQYYHLNGITKSETYYLFMKYKYLKRWSERFYWLYRRLLLSKLMTSTREDLCPVVKKFWKTK